MCGIVGYVGTEQAAPILLEGLSRLEYRGYDSAGICVSADGRLQLSKTKGRLQNLIEKTNESISDISEKTGFLTTAHFRRVFKDATGLSPQQDRQYYKRLSK